MSKETAVPKKARKKRSIYVGGKPPQGAGHRCIPFAWVQAHKDEGHKKHEIRA